MLSEPREEPVAVVNAGGTRVSGALRRLATAAVSVPLFAWIVVAAPVWVFSLLVVVTAAIGLWELTRLHERAGYPMYGGFGIALGTLVTASFVMPLEHGDALVPRAAVVVLALVAAVFLAAPLARRGRPAIEPGALTVLGILHVGWFLGHAVLLRRLPDGANLVLVMVGITWIGETAAYAVGSTMGRRALAPEISPRKTVEGSVAQLVGSMIAAVLLGPGWLLPDWSAERALLAGLLLGVVGQVGDLVESALKRSVGVKDAGGLIPGHGGVLDRIDGLLFNVPAFYYYVRLGGAA